jgi:hypothetical protein
MPLYDRDVTTPFDSLGAIPQDVFGVAINWYVNRTPLISRLPKVPVGSPSFAIVNDNYRPRSNPTAASIDASSPSLTVADGSMFTLGDVIEVEGEQMLVTAIDTDVLTVTRGYGGTTAAAHASGLTAFLITNPRTGGAVNVKAISRIPTPVLQYCQTVQHAYQVGGSLQSSDNFLGGSATPLDRDRMMAMQNCMDDFEEAAYYGRGVALASSTSRPQMKGLANLITTNKVTAPTNAAAYKPSDLVRDTIQLCFNGGGNPSLMLVSTDFLTGFAVWGHAVQRLDAGSTVFGTPVDLFEVPFLSGINLIPAPLLRPGTAICLSGPEARIRLKRPLFEKPRGSRGDAVEGDFIMEGAIELDNEAHHAWVSGITAFAAS